MINIKVYRENLKNFRITSMQGRRANNPVYKKFDANKDNISKLLEFDDELNVKGFSVYTRTNYIFGIARFLRWLGLKPLKDLTKEDVIKYITGLRNDRMSEKTVNTFHSLLSKFLLWWNGGKEYPDCIAGLKPKRNNKIKLPEDIPTEEEIKKMIAAADSIRDKAIISVLYESALRIGEFLGIKIGDLKFDDFGCLVRITSEKNGNDRMIRLVNSVPVLKVWLEQNPNRDDPVSPLWIDVCTNRKGHWHYGKPLQHGGVYGILKRTSSKAKIRKNIYPHILRHSRLTELAKRIPESMLRKVAGWKPNSNMVEIYVHYNNQAVDDILLSKVYNKKDINGENKPDVLRPVVCNRCKAENSPESDYCSKCYYPLNEKSIHDLEVVKNAIAEVIANLLNRPDIKKDMPSVIRELKVRS